MLNPTPFFAPDFFATKGLTLPPKPNRADLTARFTDAAKLVAAQFLRAEARCAAYFPTGLLLAPAPAKANVQG